MHIEKYKSDAVVGIMKHYTREHITENVERERIKGNIYCYNEKFNMPENDKSHSLKDYVMQSINDRTARKVKAKQNVVLDLVITQPEEMGTELNRKFFEDMVNALQNKYIYKGFNPFKKENMVMYAIHQDEQGQPHMHYAFMPITPNSTRRIRHEQGKQYRDIDLDHERLNSDSFMKLDFLNSFHGTMEELTGYKLTKGDNEKRDLTMQEYQNKQELEKLKMKVSEQNEQKAELEKQLKNEFVELKNTNTELKIESIKLNKEIEEKKNYIKEFKRKLDYNETIIPELKEKPKAFGQDIANEMRVNRNDYLLFQNQLREFESIIKAEKEDNEKEKEKQLKEIFAEREKTEFYKNYANCENKIKELDTSYKSIISDKDNQIDKLSNINYQLKDKVNNLDNLIEKATQPLNDKIKKLTENNKWLNKLIYNLEQFVLGKSEYTQKQLDYVEEHGSLPKSNDYTR